MGSKKRVNKKKLYYKQLAKKIGIMLGLPALIYFLFFCFYSWPWITHFNNAFFTDIGDGFQNVWNIWWVNHSVTQLHQLPWHTNMLHFPYGTTLIGQTLNPFNGFVAIGLLKIFSLVQTFNIMVIFSFVFTGVTTFWLCYYFTKKYLPSLIGGFIFTFSSYHFAHAIGHMQLVSLEWLPLFILLWWKLLLKPSYKLAIGAAVTLALVVLCDYYYFLYSIAAAAMIAIYLYRNKSLPSIKMPESWRPLALFAALAALLALPLPMALTLANSNDPLLGSHPARIFSTDVITPFLDGGFWRFSHLTIWYWDGIKAFISESSVYIGTAVWAMVGVAIWKRKKIHRDVMFWVWLGLIFGILSLGERLMFNGYSINHAPMPYALLEKIIPQLRLSGVPVRMMVMAILASAILSAMVLSKLNLKIKKQRLIFAGFFIILFFELWPAPLPITYAKSYPAYVGALRDLPYGAVLDNGALSSSWQLYDQTVTEKPMALGYISRVPTSVQQKDDKFVSFANPGNYKYLCSTYGIRYITIPAERPIDDGFSIVYKDKTTLIYDLKSVGGC